MNQYKGYCNCWAVTIALLSEDTICAMFYHGTYLLWAYPTKYHKIIYVTDIQTYVLLWLPFISVEPQS